MTGLFPRSRRPPGQGAGKFDSGSTVGGHGFGHGFGHTSQVSSSNDSDNAVAGLSELEVALLALLSIRPMTGYEILRHHARALEPW